MGRYVDETLGNGAKYNERRYEQAYKAQNRDAARANGQLVSFSNLGPLPDWNWKAFTGALSRQADRVQGGAGLADSRFNEMTPFYNAQYGGDVSNHYGTEGLVPQVGGSLVNGPAKQAMAAMKRKR